jgi:hypothetical protein
MNTSSCIGISTMKPFCRVLISYKGSSIFGFSPGKSNDYRIDNLSKFHCGRFSGCNPQIIGYIRVTDSNQRAFSVSGSSRGQSRGFGMSSHVGQGSGRGVLVIPNVASDFRNHSTSVEAHVNEKSFERIYIQGGLNVKPLVIERIETGHSVVKEEESRLDFDGSSINIDNLKGLNENTVEREVSEIEKEAWNLLRNAVVSYCGNPVGTVAANDPGDNQPLNYDQVFIRDFVPSALAFLLNGEGEIVKNFLLHTLQLQVVY